jgi:hypothetical protein
LLWAAKPLFLNKQNAYFTANYQLMPAITLQYKDYTIELFDDHAYVEYSADSPTRYDLVFTTDKNREYSFPTKHAIKVSIRGIIYKTAILMEARGATGIYSDAALIDGDCLIIRCSNQLYSLKLPDLEINWVTEPDSFTCFSIHQYHNSYIIHGEVSISRISRRGEILWSYSGADIFVSIYNYGPEFKMNENDIELTDFNGSKYKIDYDGNTLSYEKQHT